MEFGVMQFVVGTLAVWRVTHLLHAEEGPWDLLLRLRKLAGKGAAGKMLDCFYCVSVWVAIPCAFVLAGTVRTRLLLWPALSGAAILLERMTERPAPPPPLAEWHEE